MQTDSCTYPQVSVFKANQYSVQSAHFCCYWNWSLLIVNCIHWFVSQAHMFGFLKVGECFENVLRMFWVSEKFEVILCASAWKRLHGWKRAWENHSFTWSFQPNGNWQPISSTDFWKVQCVYRSAAITVDCQSFQTLWVVWSWIQSMSQSVIFNVPCKMHAVGPTLDLRDTEHY